MNFTTIEAKPSVHLLTATRKLGNSDTEVHRHWPYSLEEERWGVYPGGLVKQAKMGKVEASYFDHDSVSTTSPNSLMVGSIDGPTHKVTSHTYSVKT